MNPAPLAPACHRSLDQWPGHGGRAREPLGGRLEAGGGASDSGLIQPDSTLAEPHADVMFLRRKDFLFAFRWLFLYRCVVSSGCSSAL